MIILDKLWVIVLRCWREGSRVLKKAVGAFEVVDGLGFGYVDGLGFKTLTILKPIDALQIALARFGS